MSTAWAEPGASTGGSFDVDAVDIVGARSEQQDAFGIAPAGPDRLILALADGMGGHAHGGVASRLAVETFIGVAKGGVEIGEPSDAALDQGLDAANAAIADAQARGAQDEEMGTTFIGALLDARGLSWVSVGDSILWLVREGKLLRLNEDHSLRAIERFKGTAQGNLLTSALTGKAIADVDRRATPVALKPGDLVILASDGVLSLPEDRLARILRTSAQAPVREIADQLIAAVVAEENPRQDNATLIVTKVAESAAGEAPRVWSRAAHALTMPALMLAVAAMTASAICLVYVAL